TAIRTSLTVPPTLLRTRWTSSRSMTVPAVRRLPLDSQASAGEERTSRVERATEAPMSRARPASERAPRTRSGMRRTSGGRPRAEAVGEGVVELEQHGEGRAVLCGEDVGLPGGPGAVQRAFHEAAGRRVEVGCRRVQPDVVLRVEARVGFAAGAAEGEGAAQGRGEGFALPGPGAPERRQRAAGERAPHVPDAHPQSGDGGGAGG